MNFSAVPNPALEPYDVVTVEYPTHARSIDRFTESHIIDQITIPLNAVNPITSSTREQSLILIGSE